MQAAEKTSSTPGEIRAVLEAYLAERESEGSQEVTATYQFYELVRNTLGLGFSSLPRWAQGGAQKRADIQVLRQLNLLVAKGRLVKVSSRPGNRSTRFLVPSVANQEKEVAIGRLREQEETLLRVQAVRGRLEALGLQPAVADSVLAVAGARVQLDLEDWGRLLDMAEKGDRQ